MKNKLAAIEGILFSMGTSVTRRQLMEALEIDDEQFDELIRLLQTEYDKEERGIRLLELDDAYQLCTKTEYYGSLIRIVNHPKKPRLTDVMLETLSIIAYKQPVTKQEIEAIRGVKCDQQTVRIPADQRGWTTGCDRASDLVSYDRRIFEMFWSKINR